MKTKRDDLDRQHVRDRRKQQTATAMAHADDAVVSPCSGGARRVEYVTPLGERLPVRHPAARRQPPPAHVAQAHLPPATRLRARRVGCRAARRWIALLQRHWGNMPEARRQPGRVIGDPLPRKHPKRPRTRAPGARPPLCSTSDTDCCDSTGGARQFVGADRGRMVEWACRALFAGSWPSATPRRSSSDCGSARWLTAEPTQRAGLSGLGRHRFRHPDAGYICAIYPRGAEGRLLFEHGCSWTTQGGCSRGRAPRPATSLCAPRRTDSPGRSDTSFAMPWPSASSVAERPDASIPVTAALLVCAKRSGLPSHTDAPALCGAAPARPLSSGAG
jgi:hypothetical protein